MIQWLSKYKFFIILSVVFAVRLVGYCGGNVKELHSISYGLFANCESKNKYDFSEGEEEGSALLGKVEGMTKDLRRKSAENVREYLPSPHSELLLGLLLGINDLNDVPRFNDVVRRTGTIHVVVVSGYNVSLVFGLVVTMLGSQYSSKALLIALFVTLAYAFISGFDPPVIRAWIMGTIVALGRYYGRSIDVVQVLVFSGLLMVAISPSYIFSLSFQLSFLATLSLVVYSETTQRLFGRVLARMSFKSGGVLFEDLVATVSAQVLVWPLISYHFEQVSLVSPIVNALILWTVPIATIIGGAFLIVSFLPSVLGEFLSWVVSHVVFVFLEVFVAVVHLFSNISFAVIDFSPSLLFLAIYYFFVLVLFSFLVKARAIK